MKKIKSIAMYLPQFHRVPENDEWWGEGFTEWTAVKAAEKLWDGHNQPREPLGDNYYNLMEKETMKWQADLAKKYGIGGFCFYHYYFENGRRILEKPAENLLKWKEIQMPFCFCWANQTWARTWSNIRDGNSWSEKFESCGENSQTILLNQNYGGYDEWKAHFEYLKPFFLDERYIKLNEMPVFLFYMPDEIFQLAEMIECWNDLCKECGIKKIYAIGINIAQKADGLDAILLQGPKGFAEPRIAGKIAEINWDKGVKTYDYDELWKNAAEVERVEGVKTYIGGVVDYDDTPRRGKLGTCITGVSPEKFEKSLFAIAVKNIRLGNEFLFINAWNEWGEGNYLEPDKKYGYQYLEAVKNVMDRCNGSECNLQDEAQQEICTNGDKEKEKMLFELNKFRKYFFMMDQWMTLKERKKSVEKYFIGHNYKKIIIYGWAGFGIHLYEELKNSSIEIVCALDRRNGLKHNELKIQTMEDGMPECDVIVVTPISEFADIKSKLKEKTNAEIISLEEVLYEC